MVVETGTRLGPYEIVSRIGAGGMGEVYKARDTRLNRIVAIKVLPQDLAADPDRRTRFEREARAVAALNYPHICSLFDVGRQGDIGFLVMEYIEGETFARRLARGALPLDQVLEYAIQIAGALAQAHRLGIFHRDLKPSNIMLTGSGAKLLDFGLAKFQRGEGEAQATAEEDLTESGTLLGTAAYMAPEQLEGKDADARSDIFAFAAVVYEMAAGRRAFDATSQSGVIAAILDRDPPSLAPAQATQAPTGVSGSADRRLHALDRLLRSCLAKDPQARWQTAHDLVTELKWIVEIDSASHVPGAPPRRWRLLVWGLAGVAALTGIVLDLVYVHRAKPEQGMLQLSVLAPDKSVFGTAVVSNDGRVAFTASAGGEFKLWVRPLDSLDAQPLPGTEDASYPFWSPDGRFIGFFAVGKLKKIEVGTRSAGLRPGPVQTLCDVGNGRGASWNTDGVILFAPTNTDVLYRIPASGGTPQPVTRFDPGLQENSHRWPHFLPDGRQFLFFVRSSQPDNVGLYVGALDSQEKARLVGRLSSSVAYAAPGHLLYVRDGTLMAHPFRLESRELAGEPVGIAEKIAYDSNSYTDFSVSDNAMLVYRDGAPMDQFAWFDRTGRRSENVGPPGDYGEARLSPDGRRAALHMLDPQLRSGDIWLLELSRGVLTRVTSDPAYDFAPVWSPDGKYLAFVSNRNGPLDLYRKAAAGTGPEEPLLLNPQQKQLTDWSADGRFILFLARDPKTKTDIWILPVTGDRKPLPFLRTEYSERDGQFSPDGKWVAYTSDESGRDEVYVQSFQHDQAGKWQISTHGGSQPKWRPDGTELFYLAPDRKLMVAEVKKRSSFDAGAPRPLFEAPVQTTAIGPTGYVYTYSVSRDGNRFFIRTARPEAISRALTVVTNWKAGLRR